MTKMKVLVGACTVSFCIFAATFAHGTAPGTVRLAAMLNTNDPTSVVAFLTLSGSNLDLLIVPPPCSSRVEFVCTSTTGMLPGDTLWRQPASQSANLVVNGIIIEPPDDPPTNGGGGGSPPPRDPRCDHRATLLPPTFTNSVLLTATQRTQLLDGLCFLVFSHLRIPTTVTEAAQIVVLDTDGDGVLDSRDLCQETPAGSLVNVDGCSIDQLAPCDANWKNHGEFVRYFRFVTADFRAAGLISAAQQRKLDALCAQADCGKH